MNQPKTMQPPMRLPEVSLKEQPHGSTMTAGMFPTEQEVLTALETTMIPDPSLKTLGQLLPSLPQNGKSPESESCEKSKAVKYSIEEKKQFAITLMQVFQMLKEYGKQGQDFDVIVQGFLQYFERKEYTMQQILDALFTHLDKSQETPTPKDIENIINPPIPKIDWPLYIELKKRLREGNVYVSSDEKAFLRNCEDLGVLRQQKEMAGFNDAQRQLEQHKALMLEND